MQRGEQRTSQREANPLTLGWHPDPRVRAAQQRLVAWAQSQPLPHEARRGTRGQRSAPKKKPRASQRNVVTPGTRSTRWLRPRSEALTSRKWRPGQASGSVGCMPGGRRRVGEPSSV